MICFLFTLKLATMKVNDGCDDDGGGGGERGIDVYDEDCIERDIKVHDGGGIERGIDVYDDDGTP